MSDRSLLGLGIGGTIVAALCCFTPILVVLLGLVGLSALVGYLDVLLIPSLIFFVALTIYAVWRRQRSARGKTGVGS
jgi:mercuric ion transport protein